jgi:hypothetical protein
MKDIVSIHLGAFGINMAEELYPVAKAERPRAILADVESDSLDYFALHQKSSVDLSNLISGNNISTGDQINTALVYGRSLVDKLIDKTRR